MTRTYAARKLLEHGPLTMAALLAITGWPITIVTSAIDRLQAKHIVTIRNINGHRYYELT